MLALALPRPPRMPNGQSLGNGKDNVAADDAKTCRKVAIIDGSNVAYSIEGQQPSLRSIELVRDKIKAEGFEVVVVADAALRHQIDEGNRYEKLIDNGEIRQAPAGTDADYFILCFARELEARIVSNDRFRDREKSFPEARERVIRYMIVGDEVVLEHRAKRRD